MSPHPVMFDDQDPYLKRLREVCLDLPGAAEKVSHGRPVFYTRKVFAVYGAVVKGEHGSGAYEASMLVIPDPSEVSALHADPRFFVPAYWGPHGWIGLDFRAADVDWDEVRELVVDSFRQTATKKLVKLLEQAG